jgi:hypothetical protein
MAHQLGNMAALYLTLWLLNRRARRAAPCGGGSTSGSSAGGDCADGSPDAPAPRAPAAPAAAVWQEEALLSAVMAGAVSNLLASLRADNAADYVYMSYFLIATTTFLKIRW